MRRLALLVPAVALAAALPAQQGALPSDSAVLAMIRARVDAKLTAGIVVGLLDADGRRRIVAYGMSGTGRPLDGNSVFEIGSITKTFTGSLLAEMAGHGEVRLDDPVSKYLPPNVTVPSRDGHVITLLDLATQSSGLPRMPANFRPGNPSNPYADYTAANMYEFLSGYALPRDPGAQYEYSNLGVGLLGDALSRRAGMPLEALWRARLLDPLGMHDTRVTLTPAMRERLALGHDEGGNVVPNWDLDALAGAGALRSTANDMLTWVAANLAADRDSTRGPLAPALHAAHVPRRPAGSPVMRIGLNWHVRSAPDSSVVVWHNGGTGGYRTFAGYDPKRGVGVVLLTNGASAHDDLAFHLLVPSLPLVAPKPPAWASRATVTLPAATLDRYVGEYELAPSFHFTVTREGSGLMLEATGQGKAPIYAQSETEFYPRVVDALITFQHDSSGKVTGLVLHQNGRDQPARKIR